jgi:protein-L-isoaspartate(D-aspartate) O-methyltransferase
VETADRVHEALWAIPRTRFLRRLERLRASVDAPLPIGHGQTNSQPSTVREMLEMLDVQPGDRVLDVGSGSGWTTALLARLCGPTGQVLGVERVPQLVTFGAANLVRAGMPWARIEPARPGTLGAPDEAPFERILVSAEPPGLPPELVNQLVDGGRMVIPVRGEMVVVDRVVGARVSTRSAGYYRFVPLVVDPPPMRPMGPSAGHP